mmetsp:Transcript_15721/g.45258  ORF Transcript_15721/g.45258 Transcript_15721/m.45258 type:complete len:93 (+) Transcript_15721:83-361(+)
MDARSVVGQVNDIEYGCGERGVNLKFLCLILFHRSIFRGIFMQEASQGRGKNDGKPPPRIPPSAPALFLPQPRRRASAARCDAGLLFCRKRR